MFIALCYIKYTIINKTRQPTCQTCLSIYWITFAYAEYKYKPFNVLKWKYAWPTLSMKWTCSGQAFIIQFYMWVILKLISIATWHINHWHELFSDCSWGKWYLSWLKNAHFHSTNLLIIEIYYTCVSSTRIKTLKDLASFSHFLKFSTA